MLQPASTGRIIIKQKGVLSPPHLKKVLSVWLVLLWVLLFSAFKLVFRHSLSEFVELFLFVSFADKK